MLLSSVVAASWAQRAPAPDDPGAIVAETQHLSKRQGMVRIAGVTWRCSDRLCVATSKKAPTGVKTCQVLAEQIGYLTRFGRVARPIPSYDLALCNVRAQIRLAKIEQQRADAAAARLRRLPPKTTPVQPAAPPVAQLAPSPQRTAPSVQGTAPASQRAAPSSQSLALSPRPVAPASQPEAAFPEPRAAFPERAAPPPVVEASPIAPSYRLPVFALRVAPLAVVGKEATLAQLEASPAEPENAPAAGTSVAPPSIGGLGRVDVPVLAIVGQGRMQSVVPGAHLTVTVDELAIVGQPAAPSKD